MTATDTPAIARMIQPHVGAAHSFTEERSGDEENERGLESSDHRDVHNARESHRAIEHVHVARKKYSSQPGRAPRGPRSAASHWRRYCGQERGPEPRR